MKTEHETRSVAPMIYPDFDLQINSPQMNCRIFWARVVSSENESLFTQYTKHTFYEIQYALKGHIGMALENGKTLTVEESCFTIIPPDTYHQVVDATDGGARFIMAFSMDVPHEKFQKRLAYFHSLVSHRESEMMRHLLSLILEKKESISWVRRESLASLIESFLLEIWSVMTLSQQKTASPPDRESDKLERIQQMQRFIHRFNGIGLTVSDLAAEFHMSERHVSRLFTEITGHSAKDAINHEKLKKLEELVLSTNLSLSEIAELFGFCDEYAMNKFFRRYNLTNLSEFRRLRKK